MWKRTRLISLPLLWSGLGLLLWQPGCSDTPIEPTATPDLSTPTPISTATPVATPTAEPTDIPPTPTAEPTATAVPTEPPTGTPTATDTPAPTGTPAPTPTATPTPRFAKLTLSDDALDFGSAALDTQVTALLTLGNDGDADLNVAPLLSDDADGAFALSDAEMPVPAIEPGGSYQLEVYFSPFEEGEASGALQLTTNDPNALEVSIELTGLGVLPLPDDQDGDGFTGDVDCDDQNPNSYPGANELCDGNDNDCDGIDEDIELNTLYADTDGDGHGNPNAASTPQGLICVAPSGFSAIGDDCNDGDASIYGGAIEICDAKDNDCDNSVDEGVTSTFYADKDLDGHGEVTEPSQACSTSPGLVSLSDDCNDTDASISPTAPEQCDQIDNDCDEAIDEGLVLLTFYSDVDNDGYGDETAPVQSCGVKEGTVSDDSDCDDDRSDVYPGAPEACDGVDNDCAGDIDEDGTSAYYLDSDGDGYGDPSTQEITCAPDLNQVSDATDCNDNANTIHPGATEVCDAIDNNCNGQKDEGVTSTFYADADQDGYGNAAVTETGCAPSTGYVFTSTDCNDADNSIYPGNAETCDLKDNDCNGQTDEGVTTTYYTDGDGDGFGNLNLPVQACALSSGIVTSSTDCNDTNAQIYPGATETCDLVDNDCDTQIDEGVKTTYYLDADEDGYGSPTKTTQACSLPSGYVTNNTDCKDTNDAINPGATEVCNGVDDDCNTQIDENLKTTYYLDADQDGFGSSTNTTQACTLPSGYSTKSGDCNDGLNTIYPGAPEVCDGLDNNCDGTSDTGLTGDGSSCAGKDCASIHAQRPTAPSGFYYIDPNNSGTGFQVYCDMITSGGGWTYLATVTNNGDSTNQGKWLHTSPSPNSWESTSATFGTLDPSVNADYRSAAFHTVKATSIMITHRNQFLLRTDDKCMPGTTSLAQTFASQGWTCGGSENLSTLPACAHSCVIAEQKVNTADTAMLNGVSRARLFMKAGEADGVQDTNKDRSYFSTSYRTNIDFPVGLGAFCSGSSCTPRTGEADVNNSSDAITPTAGTEFYGIWVRRLVPELCGNGIDDDGDGQVDEVLLGDESQCAAKSCNVIKTARPDAVSNTYWIDPSSSGNPIQAYCDMTTTGGGWTLVTHYASGAYTVEGANGYILFNDVVTCPDGKRCIRSGAQVGPTMTVYGNLDTRSSVLPANTFTSMRVECDSLKYSFTSLGKSFDSSSAKNFIDGTYWWHTSNDSTFNRSSHYACGVAVGTDYPNMSSEFAFCTDGDSSGNNNGSVATLSMWQNTAYINCGARSGGAEVGTSYRVWVK